MELKKNKRISLLKVDRLLSKDLEKEEQRTLEIQIEQNQELKNYFQQSSNLHCNLQFSELQSHIKNKNILTRWHQYFSEKFLTIINTPVISTVVVTALFLMILSTSFLIQHNNQHEYLGIKGSGAREILLLTKGKSYSADQEIQVAEKDTLSFLYRSPEKMHVLLLYSEDEGTVKSFSTGNDRQLWAATLTESIAPMSIELEGIWKKQVIWVITSRKKISIGKAESIIKKQTTLPAKVYAFYLTK